MQAVFFSKIQLNPSVDVKQAYAYGRRGGRAVQRQHDLLKSLGIVNGCFSIEEKKRQIEEALSGCLAEVPPGRIRRAFLAAPWMGKQEDLAENDIFFGR